MNPRLVLDTETIINQIDAFFDGVFAPLEAWIPRLEVALKKRRRLGPISGTQLAGIIQAEAHLVLDTKDRPIYGAGFCATEALVSEGNPLAWWQGPDRALLASSTFGPGQAAIDLHRLEWFRVPFETLERHVAGPFVDYLCSNEITLTASIPVVIDEAFEGVVCADILVSSLEDQLLPAISPLGTVTLVNAQGRIVISTDFRYETGDRFGGVGPAGTLNGLSDHLTVITSQRYPFALLLDSSSG